MRLGARTLAGALAVASSLHLSASARTTGQARPLVGSLLLQQDTTPQSESSNPEETYQDELEESEELVFENRDESDIVDSHTEIFRRDEFERLLDEEEDNKEEEKAWPVWLEDFFEWLGELLRSEGGRNPERDGGFAALRGLMYLLAALLVGAVLVGIVVLVLSNRSDKTMQSADDSIIEATSSPPGHLAPNDYLTRASELAARRDYRLAIRELLLGSMSHLERAGAIRYRRGLTNRDYYICVKGPPREALRVIIGHFERIFYGRRAATQEHYAECARRFREYFVAASGS